MKVFLKIRHWQLFAIFFVIPVIIMFAVPEEVILDDSPENIKISVIIMGIYVAILMSWIWTLGINLYKRAPTSTNFKTELIFFVASFCFIVADVIFIFWTVVNFANKTELPSFLFPTLVIGHLITFICVFYCSSFLAKMLKVNELKRPVHRREWFGDAMLFVFYLIGVWNIQPRINRLFVK